jgi:hypothetical protein
VSTLIATPRNLGRPGAAYLLLVTGAAAVALLAGGLAAAKPTYAIALIVLGAATVAAFRAPVAHLTALVLLTAVVPLGVQAAYGSGGSVQAAGVLPSDVLLITGLIRAVVVLRNLRMGRRATAAALLACMVLALVALQLLHALWLGRPVTGTGAEARALVGFVGTVLIALPIVHDPAARRRLLWALLAVGLVQGLWGIAQFAFQIQFNVPTDLGGSSTDSFGTAGRVVGMYGFPVAAVLSLSALSSGAVRSAGARLALAACALLNSIAVVTTFERTFFIALTAGILALLALGTAHQRVRLVLIGPPVAAITVALLSTVNPPLVQATAGRLESLASYRSDPSVNYRIYENRLVKNQISQHPVIGSGFGAAIEIGRPGTAVPIKSRTYAENGYLWSAWKLGIPGALLLWTLLALPIAWRPRAARPGLRSVVTGARAALVGLVFATYAFPTFNQLEIAPIIGILIALVACGGRRAAREESW